MQNTAIEVDGLHESCDGQPMLRGVPFAVGGNRIFGIAGRNGDALRLADRRRSMFPRAAALYRARHAQATLGWVAEVRLILGTKWVASSELGYRAAGGW